MCVDVLSVPRLPGVEIDKSSFTPWTSRHFKVNGLITFYIMHKIWQSKLEHQVLFRNVRRWSLFFSWQTSCIAKEVTRFLGYYGLQTNQIPRNGLYKWQHCHKLIQLLWCQGQTCNVLLSAHYKGRIISASSSLYLIQLLCSCNDVIFICPPPILCLLWGGGVSTV